jgi:hypothetical protein
MFAEDLFPRLGDHDGIPAQQVADAEAGSTSCSQDHLEAALDDDLDAPRVRRAIRAVAERSAQRTGTRHETM